MDLVNFAYEWEEMERLRQERLMTEKKSKKVVTKTPKKRKQMGYHTSMIKSRSQSNYLSAKKGLMSTSKPGWNSSNRFASVTKDLTYKGNDHNLFSEPPEPLFKPKSNVLDYESPRKINKASFLKTDHAKPVTKKTTTRSVSKNKLMSTSNLYKNNISYEDYKKFGNSEEKDVNQEKLKKKVVKKKKTANTRTAGSRANLGSAGMNREMSSSRRIAAMVREGKGGYNPKEDDGISNLGGDNLSTFGNDEKKKKLGKYLNKSYGIKTPF